MYAIVEIAGQQFKVELGKKIFVHRLEAEEGKELEFDNVLLLDDDGNVTVGEPTLKGVVVGGTVLSHVRGDKVIVFKKKRKKGYRVKNGHRQNFSQIEITSINGKKLQKKEVIKKAAKAEEVATTEEKAAEKKPAKKATGTAEKKTAVKKPAEKKAPAKKAAKSKE